ncbi:MAG: hypothetical protein U9N59_07070 [Campylobacterota bacterium]|nr:hypothetical protein [Campylobacterota bacterium]
MIAVAKGIKNLDIIMLLLEHGADPTIANRFNQTTPEVLNEIILHTYNLKKCKNKDYLREIESDGNYMIILKEIISSKVHDFNYLDSQGNPLFFKPFIKKSEYYHT